MLANWKLAGVAAWNTTQHTLTKKNPGNAGIAEKAKSPEHHASTMRCVFCQICSFLLCFLHFFPLSFELSAFPGFQFLAVSKFA